MPRLQGKSGLGKQDLAGGKSGAWGVRGGDSPPEAHKRKGKGVGDVGVSLKQTQDVFFLFLGLVSFRSLYLAVP